VTTRFHLYVDHPGAIERFAHDASCFGIECSVRIGEGRRGKMGKRRPDMALIDAKFKFEQETKGALRYREVDERGIEQAGAKIGSLYLRKSAFEPGAAYPQSLRVIVETVDS
jgi:hypothetical protein